MTTCSKCGQGEKTTAYGCQECAREYFRIRSYRQRGAPSRGKHAPAITTKECSSCGQVKPLSEFSKSYSRGRAGVVSTCKPCRSLYEACRGRGITVDQYREMEAAQGYACAICGEPESTRNQLVIDHDHETGVVRALLCSLCNMGLGAFRDDPARLKDAAKYLENHHASRRSGSRPRIECS